MTGTEDQAPAEPAPVDPAADKPPASSTRARTGRRKATGTTKAAPSKPRPVGRPSNDAKLTESVTAQLVGLGMAVSAAGLAAGNPVVQSDGVIIGQHAESVAAAFVELAKENATVRRILEGGVTGSAWLGVALAVGALGRELVANHQAAAAPTTLHVVHDDGPPPVT